MSIIQINGLSYVHPDRTPLFDHISFSVESRRKIAVIGPNGIGKSTLLRLISGELQPASGEIAVAHKPYYIPQHFGRYDPLTLAGALGIEQKINALHAILNGSSDEKYYSGLQGDWIIEERARAALSRWGLDGFPLSHSFSSLSGGEKTRVFLSGIALHEPQVIVMDEPSNHLDAAARDLLYNEIKISSAAIIVATHDRTLLNQLETMIELGRHRVTVYGGNYDFYKEQKEGHAQALQERVEEKQKSLRKARQVARETAERKERQDARGKGKMKQEGISRIMLKKITDGASASAKKLKETHSDKIGSLSEELRTLKSTLPERREMKVKLDHSQLHPGKTLVTAEDIQFSYGEKPLWNAPLSFRIASGDRIAIEGKNGTGKTTLLKLIFGELAPAEGVISRANFSYLYVDQEYSLIDNALTVYEQLQLFNRRNLPEHLLKTELHRFLFRVQSWDKPCSALSGGEKMRLLFCSLLVSDAAPDLFVLDEPTNNLDIQSLEIVTESLRNYSGTLLVISHDRYFIREVGVDQFLRLDETPGQNKR